MKRTHTSTLLFLGVWLAVLMAGYMAVRLSVFAAGGGGGPPLCPRCKECAMLDTWWVPYPDSYGDYVTNGTDTPTQNAFLGTNEGGGVDSFAINCYDGSSSPNDGVTLEGVTYTGGNLDCADVNPPAPGLYQATKGIGINHSGVTLTQNICNGVG